MKISVPRFLIIYSEYGNGSNTAFFFFSTDDPTVSRLTRCCTAHTVPAPQLNQLRDLL